MAVILKEESSLKKQYKRYGLGTAILLPAGLIIVFAVWGNLLIQILGLLMMIAGGRIGYRFLQFYLGSRGESKVTKQLAKLPDNYLIINDTVIPNGDRTAQIDHILIADNGIFCIETKSHQGTIYGNETDHDWKYIKGSDSGRRYTNTFYSPIKQCITHVMALKTLLKNNGFNVFIQPVVVFTTDSTVLKVVSRTPVLKVNQLFEYIAGYKGSSQISDNDKQKIADIILQNSIIEAKGGGH